MSQGTPESRESRYEQVQSLAQKSNNRRLFFMGTTGVGLVAFFIDMAYVDQKYYPLTNTLEEIQQGIMNPSTEVALVATLGVGGFLLCSALSTLACGYETFRTARFNREANRLRHEIEKQSKRPPTLSS